MCAPAPAQPHTHMQPMQPLYVSKMVRTTGTATAAIASAHSYNQPTNDFDQATTGPNGVLLTSPSYVCTYKACVCSCTVCELVNEHCERGVERFCRDLSINAKYTSCTYVYAIVSKSHKEWNEAKRKRSEAKRQNKTRHAHTHTHVALPIIYSSLREKKKQRKKQNKTKRNGLTHNLQQQQRWRQRLRIQQPYRQQAKPNRTSQPTNVPSSQPAQGSQAKRVCSEQ